MIISVAIPVYNGEKTIFKSVESALNQDYDGDYEVLVVNNASTDNTLDVLKSISNPKLRIVTNDQTCSQFANHNVCFEKSKGDYVLILHADDELMPEAVKICAKRIEERLYPQRYILCGHSMFNDVSEWLMRRTNIPMLHYNTVFSGETALRAFLPLVTPQPTGTCYSRRSIIEIGGFPDVPARAQEEAFLTLKAALNFFEFELTDRLVLRRLYSSTQSRMTQDEERKILLDFQKDLWDHCEEWQKATIKRLCIKYNISTWNEFLNIHPRKVSKRRAMFSIMKKPWKCDRWFNLFTLLTDFARTPEDYRLPNE